MNSDARDDRTGADSRAIGDDKERLAETFLTSRKLKLLARNHRCRFGEIDLVMLDEAVLVFVEVRYRSSGRFGTPAETVDARKQKRLIAAARHYLQTHPSQRPCRFDVIAISGRDEIQWIKHAFILDSS
ncbi:YraN family protein [Thiocystis violacea]|uniref:YraN family protein n=1 Tax=Thiocystis violacea TaxID=13725 RepID=UPI001908B22E|nr:YraN family protein [Thiocystis violacea]MBK1716482.1 YraN family protein [Thiocystis violacea]